MWLQEKANRAEGRMTDDDCKLWIECRNGSATAREKLVLAHLWLAKVWAARMKHVLSWVELEDLRQLAALGVVKAVDRYDPKRSASFPAYASWWIRAEVYASPEVRRGITRDMYERSRKVQEVHDQLMVKLGRKPTVEE